MSKQLNKVEKKMQEKHRRILDSAIKLFAKNGYSETSISMIAKEADVSFGSVFTYFKNKEALFEAAVIEPLEEKREMFIDIDQYTGTPIERIHQMVSRHIKTFFNKADHHLRLVQFVLARPERFPKLFEYLDDFLYNFCLAIKPLILEGQKKGELSNLDSEVVALSYFSFLNGIRLTIIDGPDNPIWDQYINQALLLFGPISKEKM